MDKVKKGFDWILAIGITFLVFLCGMAWGVSIERHRGYSAGFHEHAYGKWHTQSWVVDFQERTCKVCGWAQRAKIDTADSKAEQPK